MRRSTEVRTHTCFLGGDESINAPSSFNALEPSQHNSRRPPAPVRAYKMQPACDVNKMCALSVHASRSRGFGQVLEMNWFVTSVRTGGRPFVSPRAPLVRVLKKTNQQLFVVAFVYRYKNIYETVKSEIAYMSLME